VTDDHKRTKDELRLDCTSTAPRRTDLWLPRSDAVTRKRELGRQRSKRHRERLSLYGKPGDGYRVSTGCTPADVLAILAGRFPSIAEAKESDDKEELGRAIDRLVAAVAYDTLDCFRGGL